MVHGRKSNLLSDFLQSNVVRAITLLPTPPKPARLCRQVARSNSLSEGKANRQSPA
jgi:hypothetical protein